MPGVENIAKRDEPISERYRLAAIVYLDKRAAWRLLDETKKSQLAVLKGELIDADPKMSDAKAERLVLSGKPWREFLVVLCAAEDAYERARQGLVVTKMRFDEWVQQSAHARHEYRMGSGHGQ